MERLFFLLIATPGGVWLEVLAAGAFEAVVAVDCLAEEDFAG